jgi:hypothetical protein
MMRRPQPAMPADVAAAFDAFPAPARNRLLEVRGHIFRVASALNGVGPLTEGLRWGQPAYLTAASGSGSTIRLGLSGGPEPGAAVFFNCRTELIETFRERFPGVFRYEKTRAILLDTSEPLPDAPLSHCLGLALTYHLRR